MTGCIIFRCETMNISGDYKLTFEQINSFQVDGHILLREVARAEEITFYRPVIQQASYRYSTEKRSLKERDTYGKAFLQITNLWEKDEIVKKFVFAHRFAQIAADLLGVEKVRLYHDQALFKEPNGGRTPWHQDQFYWNLDTDKTITMWMPLVDVSEKMGLMSFAYCSHREKMIENIPISNDSEDFYKEFIRQKGFSVSNPEPMKAGDATFHAGWTIHSAGKNDSERMREAFTIIYFADGARITAPVNEFQKADHERWLKGIEVGALANGGLNPVLN